MAPLIAAAYKQLHVWHPPWGGPTHSAILLRSKVNHSCKLYRTSDDPEWLPIIGMIRRAGCYTGCNTSSAGAWGRSMSGHS